MYVGGRDTELRESILVKSGSGDTRLLDAIFMNAENEERKVAADVDCIKWVNERMPFLWKKAREKSIKHLLK